MNIHERNIKQIIWELQNVTSASAGAQLYDKLEKEIELSKQEELNNPTNQNLKHIISQNEDNIKILKEQNESLKSQLNIAKESEKSARKEAKNSRFLSIISIGIALSSLLATILIAILK